MSVISIAFIELIFIHVCFRLGICLFPFLLLLCNLLCWGAVHLPSFVRVSDIISVPSTLLRIANLYLLLFSIDLPTRRRCCRTPTSLRVATPPTTRSNPLRPPPSRLPKSKRKQSGSGRDSTLLMMM